MSFNALGDDANAFPLDSNCNVDSFLETSTPFQDLINFTHTPSGNSNSSSSETTPITTFDDPKNPESPSSPEFPGVWNCIPQWKAIFPWVIWNPKKNQVLCAYCSNIIRTYFPGQIKKANILTIAKSEDVYIVARCLRQHEDNQTHSISNSLSSSSKLTSLYSLYNSGLNEYKTTIEFLEVVKMSINDPSITEDCFIRMTKFLGKKVEKDICDKLSSAKFFSVVADQCRGLIILRYIGDNLEPEEHLLWSYTSIWDKSPLMYLRSLNINMDRMIIYMANIPCQQCQRCTSNRITLAQLPPRAPPITSFCRLLWNLDFLKPLSHILTSIHKLWKIYPFRFSNTFTVADFKVLDSFYQHPNLLVSFIKKFDSIKAVCSQIYEDCFILDALGITMVEIQCDEKHMKILVLLQEIIDTLRETSSPDKSICDKDIVKLNQALSSLKYLSSKAQFVIVKNSETASFPRSNSDKIWEFLNLVEKFIDENQKSIYYNGKENILTFLALCSIDMFYRNGKPIYNKENIDKCFDVVYKAVHPFLDNFQKEEVVQNVMDFYMHVSESSYHIKSCLDAMRYFSTQSDSIQRFPQAYHFFSLMATLPFQPACSARSLFCSSVKEQKIENSVWSKFKDDIKPWVLYIIDFGAMKHRVILNWWLESLDAK